jgi:hypothetical protein
MAGVSHQALIAVERPWPTCSYRSSVADTTDSSTHTFLAVDIGTAAAGRFVVIGTSSGRGVPHTVTGVTIGGNAASVIVQRANSESTVSLWGLVVPTGTTATVVVTTSASVGRVIIGSWANYDLISTTAQATNNAITDPATLNLNTTTGGIIIAFAATFVNAATISWTGITSRFTLSAESVVTAFGASNDSLTATETPRSISGDVSSAVEFAAISASWR